MTLIEKARTYDTPPLWLMRQAGRYLPEYRAVRQNYPSFIDFCYSLNDAARVTLQPIERFDFDAAILFSDILVIPDAVGQNVTFVKNHGPKLGEFHPELLDAPLEQTLDHLQPVFKTVQLLREQLSPQKSLIGFCGAPWTVLTYMIGREGSKDHAATKVFAAQDPERFQRIIMRLATISAAYLKKQIEAGADTVQVFDSWAGSVPASCFDDWVVTPMRLIVETLKEAYPHVDIIGFPKGAGPNLSSYVRGTGVDAVGIDAALPLNWVVENTPKEVVLQGNLDPTILVAGGKRLKEEVDNIHTQMRGRPYIFNLGHGILQQTPVDNVEALVDYVRGLKR